MEKSIQTNRSRGELQIDDKSFLTLAKLVEREAGIVLNASKKNLVVSRLTKRLRDLSLVSFADYCRLIEGSEGRSEMRSLVSMLTTNVTRFFREAHHFEALDTIFRDSLVDSAKNGNRIRIWSAGCSSGEEPYSIAATILNVLPNANNLDVKILATDIDQDVVRLGRVGEFNLAKNTSIPSKFSEFFLHKVSKGSNHVEVTAQMRGLVTFEELNLLHKWPMSGVFDVIFCRNTVIYFENSTQQDLWSRFAKVTKIGGFLFIGHSERISGPASSSYRGVGVTQYTRC